MSLISARRSATQRQTDLLLMSIPVDLSPDLLQLHSPTIYRFQAVRVLSTSLSPRYRPGELVVLLLSKGERFELLCQS